jgi:cyclin-dependent kinase 12/13
MEEDEYEETPSERRASKKSKKDKKHKKQKKSKKRKKKRHKSISSVETISENEDSLLGADDSPDDSKHHDTEDRTYTPELNTTFAPVSPGKLEFSDDIWCYYFFMLTSRK